jgi:hypothetical protein
MVLDQGVLRVLPTAATGGRSRRPAVAESSTDGPWGSRARPPARLALVSPSIEAGAGTTTKRPGPVTGADVPDVWLDSLVDAAVAAAALQVGSDCLVCGGETFPVVRRGDVPAQICRACGSSLEVA